MELFQFEQTFSAQWTRLLLSCALALPMATLVALPAKSQRPIRLTSLTCYQVGSSFGGLGIIDESRDVVVSRQFYSATITLSLLFGRPRSEVACKLPPNSQTLSLTLMFDDRNDQNSDWTLNFYVDGRSAGRASVRSGARQPVRIDLSGGSNLTIEAIHRSGSPFLYSSEAEIQLQPGSGRRP
jgi:hypothetical protein